MISIIFNFDFIPFANKDSEVTIITESKDIIIIQTPETLIKENSSLIIPFYDSNFYPSNISNNYSFIKFSF